MLMQTKKLFFQSH